MDALSVSARLQECWTRRESCENWWNATNNFVVAGESDRLVDARSPHKWYFFIITDAIASVPASKKLFVSCHKISNDQRNSKPSEMCVAVAGAKLTGRQCAAGSIPVCRYKCWIQKKKQHHCELQKKDTPFSVVPFFFKFYLIFLFKRWQGTECWRVLRNVNMFLTNTHQFDDTFRIERHRTVISFTYSWIK